MGRLEQRNVLSEVAAKHGVSAEIHPLDYIFQFLFDNPCFASKEDAMRFYFDDGAGSARRLADLITDICGIVDRRYTLLEFGAGYGQVTRHLSNALESCTVTASDLHRSAVEFIEKALGVSSIPAPPVPEKLDLTARYDVVFALSFFSRMPKRIWAGWLNALVERVAPSGFLIFTTQGLLSRQHLGLVELDSDGFWHAPSKERKVGKEGEYGQCVVHPRYALEQVFRQGGCELALFQEGAWWKHQDLYILRKGE